MRVYIAGLHIEGDPYAGARITLDASKELLAAGHSSHLSSPDVCQAVIHLPGGTSNADGEIERARAQRIPVYSSVAEFLAAVATVDQNDVLRTGPTAALNRKLVVDRRHDSPYQP